MGITKIRANQIFGYSSFPKAYLNNLIPSSNRPNTTGNFILEGAFFTQNMTVVIEGQTVNKITFVSDNKVIVNVTTGAIEGTFDVTLNNGSGTVIFADALFVVIGDVFEPTTDDWIQTNPVDAMENNVYTTVFGSQGSALWNTKELDFTKDFSVRFNFKKTPLGDVQTFGGGNAVYLQLLRVSDSVPVFQLRVGAASSRFYFGAYSLASGWADTGSIIKPGAATLFNSDPVFRLDFIDGVMILYENGAIKRTFSDELAGNLKLKISVQYFDIVDIKYIELA